MPTDTFGFFALQTIADLKGQEDEARKIDPRTGRVYKVNYQRIGQLLKKWGDVRIADITDDDLNDWVRLEYRVRVRVRRRS